MAIRHHDIQAMRNRINSSLSGPKPKPKGNKRKKSKPKVQEEQFSIFDFLEILALTA